MKIGQKLAETINGVMYQCIGFPMEYLSISQGCNGSFSHQGVNALDLTGKDAGIDETIAMADMHLVWYDNQENGNTVFFESDRPVLFADGTIDFFTCMFIHDNYIGDLIAKKNFKQGETFGDEGTAGLATGNHSHFEIAKGIFVKPYAMNSQGVWQLPNSISPDKACFIDGTVVINNGQPFGSGNKMCWKKLEETKVYEWKKEGVAFYGSKEGIPVYRLFNKHSSEHFYTTNKNEHDSLVNVGWESEGVAWYSPWGGEEVYRLYNPNNGFHHYTLDAAEVNKLIPLGWKLEHVGFRSDSNKEVPVYRAYLEGNGDHLLTTSEEEYKGL